LKISNSRNTGYTLPELLASLCIISVLLFHGIAGFSSFMRRAEIQNQLRAVSFSLSKARYDAIRQNRVMKISIKENIIYTQLKKHNRWELYSDLQLKNVSASTNRSPVFHPDGMVSPLCSIYISNKYYSYKISISIAGRFKITRIL